MPSLPPADKKDYEGRLKEARHAAKRGSGGPRLMGGAGAARQPDHYKLLSLERSCSVEEVRLLFYRSLCPFLHLLWTVPLSWWIGLSGGTAPRCPPLPLFSSVLLVHGCLMIPGFVFAWRMP